VKKTNNTRSKDVHTRARFKSYASLHDVDDCDVDGMDDSIAHRDSSITKQQQLYPWWPSLNV
jgi:hypothetical protein